MIKQSPLVYSPSSSPPRISNCTTANTISFPDSLTPLYIAFLAWDEYVATHDKDGLAGAPKVPGETDPEVDTEEVTGIALKIVDDLLKATDVTPDEEDLASINKRTGAFVQEL